MHTFKILNFNTLFHQIIWVSDTSFSNHNSSMFNKKLQASTNLISLSGPRIVDAPSYILSVCYVIQSANVNTIQQGSGILVLHMKYGDFYVGEKRCKRFNIFVSFLICVCFPQRNVSNINFRSWKYGNVKI